MEQRKRRRQEEEVSAFRSLPRKFPSVEVIKVTRASRVGQASAVLLVNTGTKHSPDHWGRLRVLDGYPKENGRSSETLLITSIPSHTTEKPPSLTVCWLQGRKQNIRKHRHISRFCDMDQIYADGRRFLSFKSPGKLTANWWWWAPGSPETVRNKHT